MTNFLIFLLAVLIGIPLGDWYHDKKLEWEQWKRDNWMPRHPSTRKEPTP